MSPDIISAKILEILHRFILSYCQINVIKQKQHMGQHNMKVLIISSGKADMIWEKHYNSTDYEEVCRRSLDCDIEEVKGERIGSNGRPVYVASGKGAMQTAKQCFTDAEITVEPLLDEVLQRSYKDIKTRTKLYRFGVGSSWLPCSVS